LIGQSLFRRRSNAKNDPRGEIAKLQARTQIMRRLAIVLFVAAGVMFAGSQAQAQHHHGHHGHHHHGGGISFYGGFGGLGGYGGYGGFGYPYGGYGYYRGYAYPTYAAPVIVPAPVTPYYAYPSYGGYYYNYPRFGYGGYWGW
jgi:hypothetical protein